MAHTPKRRIEAIEEKPMSGFLTGCERAYACNALLLPTKAAAASLKAGPSQNLSKLNADENKRPTVRNKK